MFAATEANEEQMIISIDVKKSFLGIHSKHVLNTDYFPPIPGVFS